MTTHLSKQLSTGNGHTVPKQRHRLPSRRPLWIIVLVPLLCVLFIGAHVYPPHGYKPCYLFSSNVCAPLKDWLPPSSIRELTDEELNSHAIIKDILSMQPVFSKTPKIAFMFLTPGFLPFEKLWEKFFQGNEDKFSIYVHASREKPIHTSHMFFGSDIRSGQVTWGQISMVDAERRLLANAFQDHDNHRFLLLSDSCVPLHNFDYTYRYLMETNMSFVDCFEDPGPLGSGRYSQHMMPEVEKTDFRKGSQWFSIKRQHALLILADHLYYTKFKLYCKADMDGHNCYADEHYLPTFLHMLDPSGIANWSITHVDWSEQKWHPKSYMAQNVTFELIKNITSIDESIHVTSDKKKEVTRKPCMWNGTKRQCYLFARKFLPDALQSLTDLFSELHGIKHFI